MLTVRSRLYNQEEYDKILVDDLDTVDELRDLAKIKITTNL